MYAAAAESLGKSLVSHNIGLVYGGGNVGLMGILADSVMSAGGEVIGVIPDFLLKREVGHRGITQLEVVESMHQRKKRMADLADAFIAAPGGWGTLEEIAEQGKETFMQAGSESFTMIPCLNVHPMWVKALASWIKDI